MNVASSTTAPASPSPTSVVVFGLDDKGKPHASRFGGADAALAERAAGLMGLRVLPVTTPEAEALAAGLPAGRVFASGKAFVPFLKASTFAKLEAAPGTYTPARPPEADGAVKAAGAAASGDLADAAGQGGAEPEERPGGPGERPRDWSGVVTGSLVLASTGAQEGWFECVVVADRGEDLFELCWRDWPDEPLIVRRRDHLALLHPDSVEAPTAGGDA